LRDDSFWDRGPEANQSEIGGLRCSLMTKDIPIHAPRCRNPIRLSAIWPSSDSAHE
jgi:hypothetical protein